MRILIAEDDQVLADGLLRTLRGSGAVVDHVASGTEADAALMTNTEFDLLTEPAGNAKAYTALMDEVGKTLNPFSPMGGSFDAQVFLTAARLAFPR